jgi:hypothetical protein
MACCLLKNLRHERMGTRGSFYLRGWVKNAFLDTYVYKCMHF